MKGILCLFLIGWSLAGSASSVSEMEIRTFYADLNKGDSLAVRGYLHPTCRIKHADSTSVWDLSVDDFMSVCPKFKSDYYSEEITALAIRAVSGDFVYADISFDFYVEGTYTHSGVDHFCWTNRNGKFLVESVYSATVIEPNPISAKKETLNQLMNKWHKDVATFNEEEYYGFMSHQFIFLGTDPSERWTREEFITFCKPYFERKRTWDFKTNWRNFYFSDDQRTAWFEESLDTQMEECRGSGVLEWIDGEWKISHYNLAVVIENEKMKKFIKLRRK